MTSGANYIYGELTSTAVRSTSCSLEEIWQKSLLLDALYE
jgi:hypothetical protein